NPRFHDELANVCRKEKISLLPYSPMAGGVISGKYNNEFIPDEVRFAIYLKDKSKRVQAMANRFVNNKTLEATKKYIELSKNYGISPITLAVSYSKHFDFVASTIIGARKAEQLEDSFKAFDFKIDDELLRKIENIQKEILYPMG
ncbi:MAG TPA: aldo/keto reductase, partial [Aliarcobacter thereius]